jgi:cytochrome P450
MLPPIGGRFTPPLDADPPEHTAYRRFLLPLFTPSHVARYEQTTREVAREIIATFVDRGSCELLSEFSAPFTATALVRTVLDCDDTEEIRKIQELVAMFAKENSAEAYQGIHAFAEHLLADRRTSGEDRDDVIQAVLTGMVDDRPLTGDEQVGIIKNLLFGGLDTTKGAITNIIHRVTERPDLEDVLREPDGLSASLDELLRFDTPVQGFIRTVTRDAELNGQPLKQGDIVFIAFASANRDDRVFESPNELRPGRPVDAQRLTFGLGIHQCVGRHFARLQLKVAIGELLAQVKGIQLEPDAEIQWTVGHTRQPARLPIRFGRSG